MECHEQEVVVSVSRIVESTYSDETSCDDDKLCRWAFKVDNCAGGICPFYHACEESCYVIHQDRASCDGDNMCRWLEDVGECTAACIEIVGDEMACNAAPGCEWYYRAGGYSCWDECATRLDRSWCEGSEETVDGWMKNVRSVRARSARIFSIISFFHVSVVSLK